MADQTSVAVDAVCAATLDGTHFDAVPLDIKVSQGSYAVLHILVSDIMYLVVL